MEVTVSRSTGEGTTPVREQDGPSDDDLHVPGTDPGWWKPVLPVGGKLTGKSEGDKSGPRGDQTSE